MKSSLLKILFRNVYTAIVLIVCCSSLSFGQNNQEKDSLLNWSYEELLYEYDKYAKFSADKALIYCEAYLKKAKIEKDENKISHAFTQIITISDSNTALQYCDSIIKYTQDSPSIEYPGWAYLYKGIIYFSKGKYAEGIENSSKAYRAAILNNNDKHLFYLNQEIGQLKLFWGEANDAVYLFKNQLDIIDESNDFGVNIKLSTLYNLANSYIVAKKQDSSSFFNRQGLELSIREKSEFYTYFLSQSGEILFHKNQLDRAKDSLLKSLEIDKSFLNSENTYNILGQIALSSKDTLQALEYFLESDKINSITKDYTPETRITHTFLRDYYLKTGDFLKFDIYNVKLNNTDSVLTKNYKIVNRKIVQDFEIPKIEIENGIVSNESFTGRNLASLVILLSISTFFSGVFLIKVRKKPKMEVKKQPETLIKPEVYRKIEEQLQKFEEDKLFTQKGLNLRSLSKKLRTNESYLSRVINSSKGQSLRTYLSELRITYCVEELNSNTKYHKFDMTSLAHEFGFNTVDSFTKAFSKKTGNTPAAYIKDLKKAIKSPVQSS